MLNCITVSLIALRLFINKLGVRALLKSEQGKWQEKFRTSNTVLPGIAFTICEFPFDTKNGFEQIGLTGLFRCFLAPENSCSI